MSQLRAKWAQAKASNKQIREDGRCVIRRWVKTGTVTRINVVCPYHEDFVHGARQLAGRWREKTAVWSFESHQYESVYKLSCEVFGKKGVEIDGQGPI